MEIEFSDYKLVRETWVQQKSVHNYEKNSRPGQSM